MLFIYNWHRIDVDLRTTVCKKGNVSDVITEKFSQLYNMSGGRISRRALKQFTEDNLSGPGDELEEWTPADWTDK